MKDLFSLTLGELLERTAAANPQTEAAPVITQTWTDDSLARRVSTVGRALPNIEVKIVDPATNEEVPRGSVGEVVCRGFNVMKGYYKMPEATAQAIDRDGWLRSGDLGTMDRDGYVWITGRIAGDGAAGLAQGGEAAAKTGS